MCMRFLAGLKNGKRPATRSRKSKSPSLLARSGKVFVSTARRGCGKSEDRGMTIDDAQYAADLSGTVERQ